MALCKRKAGLYREAAIVYRELALKAPHKTDLTEQLAFCLFKMGKGALADKLLTSACKHFPEGAGLNLLLAWLLKQGKKYERAVTHYQRAIELSPKDKAAQAQARAGLAEIYEAQGLHEMAARYRAK
jgi:tetratricopeptide (TPR) repeat protein